MIADGILELLPGEISSESEAAVHVLSELACRALIWLEAQSRRS